MKTLFLALMMAFSITRMQAAVLNLDGNLTYNISEPICTFKLKGTIKNTGPSSGTLKMLLTATPNPFNSPRILVGEFTLGTLPTGYQITDFTFKIPAKMPTATSSHNMTISIVEYTGAGWKTVFVEEAGSLGFKSGHVVGQTQWTLPTTPVIPPIGKLRVGTRVLLTAKSSGLLNLFPSGFQEKPIMTVTSKTKLETILNARKRTGSYKFAVKNGKYNNKLSTFSQITTDYGSGSKSTVSLYFQGTSSGTYKNIETSSAGKVTTWGTFKIK